MLQLCVSQSINERPYRFKATGVNVYSFEEALFHVYGHWRQTADEFLADDMVKWVNAIGHGYLAARMRELGQSDEFSKRLTGFLGLVEYFDAEQMDRLAEELLDWEKGREWESLKQQADEMVRAADPAAALPLYRRAMEYEHNAELVNNYGVALLMLGRAQEALRAFTRALALAPSNRQMMLHYVEAAIMADMPDRAARRLKRVADADAGCPDAAFLQGLAAARAKNYTKALALFEQGRSMAEADGHFAFAAADVHLALRQFDAAYTALAALPPTGDKFIKEAEVHAAAGDFAAAARAMRRANALGACHAGVFTRLATFSRAAKDLPAAEAAIARALAISPNAQDARLEAARIKKARGQTAEYRAILAEILAGMKEQYRLDGKG